MSSTNVTIDENSEFKILSDKDEFQDTEEVPDDTLALIPDLNISMAEPNEKRFHSRIAKFLWMVSVNLYDFVGLLDLFPCGTLHSTKPYVSYFYKE